MFPLKAMIILIISYLKYRPIGEIVLFNNSVNIDI